MSSIAAAYGLCSERMARVVFWMWSKRVARGWVLFVGMEPLEM